MLADGDTHHKGPIIKAKEVGQESNSILQVPKSAGETHKAVCELPVPR